MRIVFVTDNMPWSIIIRWFTWSKYSHVGLLFSDNEVIDATLRKGVSKKTLEEYKKKYKNIKTCSVPNVNEFETRVFAEKQLGKPYDWKALFGMLIRRKWTDENSWFCSELVAVALHKGGVTIIKKEASRVTPEDLLNSPLIT